MDRREALKGLATLASGAGMTVAPVMTEDVKGVEMVIFRIPGVISMEQAQRLRAYWSDACEGTALAGVKTVVLTDGVDIEFVRTK
jgi:hypothetical protein